MLHRREPYNLQIGKILTIIHEKKNTAISLNCVEPLTTLRKILFKKTANT